MKKALSIVVSLVLAFTAIVNSVMPVSAQAPQPNNEPKIKLWLEGPTFIEAGVEARGWLMAENLTGHHECFTESISPESPWFPFIQAGGGFCEPDHSWIGTPYVINTTNLGTYNFDWTITGGGYTETLNIEFQVVDKIYNLYAPSIMK